MARCLGAEMRDRDLANGEDFRLFIEMREFGRKLKLKATGSSSVLILLLPLFGVLLSSIMGVILLVLRRAGRQPARYDSGALPRGSTASFMLWPGCWLAIQTSDSSAVQSALGLRNPKPCSWLEGLAGEGKVFITPTIRGCTPLTGTGLPEPSADVDACFRFILELSRRLGPVQFFSDSRFLQYHAWVQADHGQIVRPYAWAEKRSGTKDPKLRKKGSWV
jgi:hypothetical protein